MCSSGVIRPPAHSTEISHIGLGTPLMGFQWIVGVQFAEKKHTFFAHAKARQVIERISERVRQAHEAGARSESYLWSPSLRTGNTRSAT